jgi:hypothetical protein
MLPSVEIHFRYTNRLDTCDRLIHARLSPIGYANGKTGLTCPATEIVQMRNLAILSTAIIKLRVQLARIGNYV